jgi:hypothetical protein
MNIYSTKSKKLFYKKYLYRIKFDFLLSHIFSYQKSKNLSYVKKTLFDYQTQLTKKPFVEIGHYRKNKIFSSHVDDAILIKDALIQLKDYTVRSEYNSFIIYCNVKKEILDAFNKLKSVHLVEVCEPDMNIVSALEKEPNILISKFANEYQYKVTLDFFKIRRNNDTVLSWITANRNKIKISDYSLNNATSFVGIYVRDEKVLMLLQISAEQFIKKIEKLILPAKTDK